MLQVDLGKNSWELYRNKRKTTRLSHDADVARFIEIRPSKTLAERLFGFHNEEEMAKTGRSIAWVKTLPEVVAALNNEETRLNGEKPNQSSLKYKRPVGFGEKRLPSNPGEWEGGQKRATDSNWSLKVNRIELRSVTKINTPLVYYLLVGLKRGFLHDYWKRLAVIKKLQEQAKKLCFGKPSGNLFARTKIHVPRPKFDVSSPNAVHLADLRFYHTANVDAKLSNTL
ncbi:hypothetical protein P5673_015191 [Acropora cervicornis]|uniref:Uncharacterized protein n=1 Tax=Acropora cervicornis TaxID=6130 RepID=A0AAD9QJ18_ACRCE|nr:hypothetical protein P5673_015191 [Acropora cervicornis]